MLRALLTLLLLAGPLQASPAAAIVATLEDAAAQGDATTIRYFYQPGGYSADAYAAAAMHFNLLSREGELTPPRVVRKDLLAVNMVAYGWDAKTWEKFADVEPYFHEQAIVPVGGVFASYWVGGAGFKPGWYRGQIAKKEIRNPIPARWVASKEIEALYELTNNNVPILRFDWFFGQTVFCEDRPVGYYEMLGLKNRKDVEDLGGLIKAIAEKRRKVQMAYLGRSGVAVNNRGIEWNGAYDGDYWFTKDSTKDTGKFNVVRLLNGDLDWEAEEIYATLPNGLPLMAASNKAGVLQRIVPSKIAGNHKNPVNNDVNIHVPYNCMTCHVEIIRPFSDDARRLYRNQIQLQSPDPVKFYRLKQLYLTDIDATVKRSQERFAARVKECNGLTPAKNAAAYGAVWQQYIERPLGLAEIALEMGVKEERLAAVIRGRIKANLADPVLAGLVQEVDGQPAPVPLRREHWEEVIGVLWSWLDYKP